MAIDVGRVVQAALEAATQAPSSDGEPKPSKKPRLSGGRALLLGAGLVTVGRLVAPKGRQMLDSLQQSLEASESSPEDEHEGDETDDEYDEEPEDEFDEEEDEEEQPPPRKRAGTRARSRRA